jgi:hypothetical protein
MLEQMPLTLKNLILFSGLILSLCACGGGGGGDDKLVGVTPASANNTTTGNKPAEASSASTASEAAKSMPQVPSSSAQIPSSATPTSQAASSRTITAINSSAPLPFTGASSKTSSSQLLISSSSSKSSIAASSSSAASSLTPEATSLQIYRLSTTSITLSWEHPKNTPELASYEISRNGTLIATLEYPQRYFTDSNLTPNTEYSYTITSVTLTGSKSVTSNNYKIKTLVAPSAPNSLSNSSTRAGTPTSAAPHNSASSLNNSNASAGASTSAAPTNSANSSSNVNSSASSLVTDNVKISWAHPTFRENGNYLELDEIAGYELRIKKTANENAIYLVIEGNNTTEYTLTELTSSSTVDLAVYDTNGLYSDFIAMYPN